MISKPVSANNKHIWADRPTEIALYAYNYLKQTNKYQNNREIYILNAGCGDGRDARFLVRDLPCHILAIDSNEETIAAARRSLNNELLKHIEFLYFDFKELHDKFDIILVSDLYHTLEQKERIEFRKTVRRCLKTDGMLFLSTLSLRDSLNSPAAGMNTENNNGAYCYLARREELEKEFDFLDISALFEWEYDDPRHQKNNHHISWMLVGTHK